MSERKKPVHEQKIEFYEGPAGGWGALRSVKNALLKHNIPVKGARTLLSANQPDGFDCPGCAWHSDFWLEDQGRITHPMVYDSESDRYLPIEWDAAFALVARHLNGLSNPNEAIFYTCCASSATV